MKQVCAMVGALLMICMMVVPCAAYEELANDAKALNESTGGYWNRAMRNVPGTDEYNFDQVRRPISDSQAEFDQLILLLSKLIIDLLNEKELSKGI